MAFAINKALPFQLADNSVQYNGVYKSTISVSSEKESWDYLRFYPDGTVITISSAGQPGDLKKWFSKEHKGVAWGKFALRDAQVSFSAGSTQGKVNYTGAIEGNQIRFQIYSQINNFRGNKVYEFIKWDASQDTIVEAEKTRKPIAKPFGLKMGMSLTDIGGRPEILENRFYKLSSVPNPHSSFESYAVKVAPRGGLYFIKAVGKDVATSSYGAELIAAFNEMEGKLEAIYGKHRKINELFPGSIWDEPNEWMMGLIQKERMLVAV